jgi:hypothetical protein
VLLEHHNSHLINAIYIKKRLKKLAQGKNLALICDEVASKARRRRRLYGFAQIKMRRIKRRKLTINKIKICVHLLKLRYLHANILLRAAGVQINALMAGTAWNLRKYMEKLKDNFLLFIFRLFFSPYFYRIAR